MSFDIRKILKRAGYKMSVVIIKGKKQCIIVKDKDISNPELKPVALGGKPVI